MAQKRYCDDKPTYGVTEEMRMNPDSVCSLILKDRESLKHASLFLNAKVLWADNVQFSHLPKGIMDLKNLKYLDISVNKLKKLPKRFGRLKELEYLDLSANNLKSLPDNFDQLVMLDTLDLSLNRLTESSVLFKMTNLKLLTLYHNPLNPDFLLELRKALPNCKIEAGGKVSD